MNTDPDQLRAELTALLDDIPDPEAPDADVEAIAARLEQAHELLVDALQSVERGPVSGSAAGAGTER